DGAVVDHGAGRQAGQVGGERVGGRGRAELDVSCAAELVRRRAAELEVRVHRGAGRVDRRRDVRGARGDRRGGAGDDIADVVRGRQQAAVGQRAQRERGPGGGAGAGLAVGRERVRRAAGGDRRAGVVDRGAGDAAGGVDLERGQALEVAEHG